MLGHVALDAGRMKLRCWVGISEAYLSQLLSGARLPSLTLANVMSRLLGIPTTAWSPDEPSSSGRTSLRAKLERATDEGHGTTPFEELLAMITIPEALATARRTLDDKHSTSQERKLAEEILALADAASHASLPQASREAIENAFGVRPPSTGKGLERVQGGFATEFKTLSPAEAQARLEVLLARGSAA
jgi:hypothetical protein